MAVPEKYLKPDSKGRIQLGRLAKDIVRFRVEAEPDGTIKLFPEVAVPLNEAWLYNNKAALNAVIEGFNQVQEGNICKRESFTKYLDE